MFDVGFAELMVIFVLALLVLGPERLPRVAREVGQWAGRARRMARSFTSQFQEELDAIDPRRIMDPPPAATPDYSRPGADSLKPGAPTNEASDASSEELPPSDGTAA